MDELREFYDAVARVAYDLYEKRGRIHGYDLEDWLKAETIVKKQYEKNLTDRKIKTSAKPKTRNGK